MIDRSTFQNLLCFMFTSYLWNTLKRRFSFLFFFFLFSFSLIVIHTTYNALKRHRVLSWQNKGKLRKIAITSLVVLALQRIFLALFPDVFQHLNKFIANSCLRAVLRHTLLNVRHSSFVTRTYPNWWAKMTANLKVFKNLCLISVTTGVQGKTVRMLTIVVVLFGFCWLPYHIVYMYLDFSQSQYTQAITSLVLLVQWLMFANSACNPVVYAVLNVNFRRKFFAMLFRQQTGRRLNNEHVSIRVQTVRSAV